jgi:hypothetical protein
MAFHLYISLQDIILLDIRKVVVQPKSNRVLVYFHHPSMPKAVAFSASLSFHLMNHKEWYTSFQLHESIDVTVDTYLKTRVKNQLTTIFTPYFDSTLKGMKIW